MSHTLLVVEDEADLREMIREVLESHGYSVVTATEGRAALEAIAKIESPCLVLLDLLMPGMNGWDFLAEIRSRPEYAAVPVIVHSSTVSGSLQGATRVLQKPLELASLLGVVREFCAA